MIRGYRLWTKATERARLKSGQREARAHPPDLPSVSSEVPIQTGTVMASRKLEEVSKKSTSGLRHPIPIWWKHQILKLGMKG